MERRQRMKLLGMGSLGLVFLLLVALPGYLLAEQRGALPLFWQLVTLYFAVLLPVCAVSVAIRVTRGRRRRRAYLAEAAEKIRAFSATHSDRLSFAAPVWPALTRALSELHLPATGSAKGVIWAAREGALELWALDPRVRLIAEIPAFTISSIAFRPVPRVRRYLTLSALIDTSAGPGVRGAVELPLVAILIGPKYSTERGRARLIDLIDDALFRGVVADLPDDANVLLTG